jgi:hypothetical protein
MAERRGTGTGKSLDRGIAWLNDGHKKDSETAKEDAAKQAEEYLLGKAIAANTGKTAGDFDTAAAHEGVHAIVPAAVNNKDIEADVTSTSSKRSPRDDQQKLSAGISALFHGPYLHDHARVPVLSHLVNPPLTAPNRDECGP